jgi:hypothetical protein
MPDLEKRPQPPIKVPPPQPQSELEKQRRPVEEAMPAARPAMEEEPKKANP